MLRPSRLTRSKGKGRFGGPSATSSRPPALFVYYFFMPDEPDLLKLCLNAWARQAQGAATGLLQLYTRLGNSSQRQRANCILDSSRNWLARNPLKLPKAPPAPPLPAEPPPTALEVWRDALEATTGILISLRLSQDVDQPTYGIQHQITAYVQASNAAVLGLKGACPDPQALEGAPALIDRVLEACGATLEEAYAGATPAVPLGTMLEVIGKALQAQVAE